MEKFNNIKTSVTTKKAMTQEVCKKISERTKEAMWRPEVRKKYLEAMSKLDLSGENNPAFGRKWMNNGTETIYVKNSEVNKYISIGYVFGTLHKSFCKKHSDSTKHLMSKQRLNRKWMNNGTIQCFVKQENVEEKLNQGFVFGRIKLHSLT